MIQVDEKKLQDAIDFVAEQLKDKPKTLQVFLNGVGASVIQPEPPKAEE